MKATKQKNNPKNDEIISGVVENAVIPSKAYFINLKNDHFVFPATLSTFLYSNHLTLYPTKLNNPFEYLLYSLIEIIEFATCLVINIKSHVLEKL